MCKDAAGRTLTSDRPIAECAGPVREFGSSGQLKRTVPPPLTPEQKKLKLAEEEKQKADAAVAAEHKRQDQAMLTRYSNEADINASRKRALDQEQEQLKRENISIADAEKQLKAAKDELVPFTIKHTQPPQALTRKIATLESAIRDSQKIVKDHEEQIVDINAKFDATLKRFQELTTPAAPK